MASSIHDTQTQAPEQTREYSNNREKYWKELSIEERIERMRHLVKSLVATSDRQQRELSEIKSFIWEHAHEDNGDVVIKVKKQERYRLEKGFNEIASSLKAAGTKSDEEETYI